MSLSKIQAVAIISIMLMVLAVPAITDHSNSSIVMKADTSISKGGGSDFNSTGGYLYYTVYDQYHTNFTDGIVTQYLASMGVSAQNYGIFLNFNISTSMEKKVNSFLNNLKTDFGINYSVSSGNSRVSPNVLYSPVTAAFGSAPSYYVPSQIASAYNFNWAYQNNIKGNGTTIGIVDAYGDPNIMYDLGAFDNVTGLPPANLKVIYTNSSSGSSFNNSWAIETATDVEWAHAMAPYAKIVLLLTDSSSFNAMQTAIEYAVEHRISNILSFSWGSPESGVTNSTISSFNMVLKAAADQGMSVFAASGDFGAYDHTNHLTVNFPASSPYVTSVGGTSLYDNSGAFSQTAWGGILNGKSYGSGGGYSKYFSKPYWQNAPSINSTVNYRGVPDVSLDASNNTGVLIISEGKSYKVGGTSIATPMWAAIGSILDQYNNRDMGLLNPLLYQISRTNYYGKAFTQITSGGNGYYSAHSGWNPVTGLGTPNVSYLMNISEQLLLPYGSNVIINSGNYSYTTVSANIDPSTLNDLNKFGNGSTFYYVSFYSSSTNFIKFGLDSNSTGIFPMLELDQGGTWINQTLSSNTYHVHSFNVSETFQNDTLKLSINGSVIHTMPLFVNFQGGMEASYGVEQINSTDNLTPVAGGNFSGIAVYSNTSSVPINSMFETHFSGISTQANYSNLSIFSSGNRYVVENGYSNNSEYINGTSASNPVSIYYNLTFTHPVNGTFHIHGYTKSVTWKVNGNAISGSGYTFPGSGYYNVSAYSSGLISGTSSGKFIVSREVFIPNIVESKVNISSNISYDSVPAVSVTINNLYQLSLKGGTDIPELPGSNRITATSPGFRTANETISGGVNYNFTMTAEPVLMNIFANPGFANVSADNMTFTESGGMFRLVTYPREVEINITANGYLSNTTTVKLMPGNTYSGTFYLHPLHALQTIVGRVTDRIFKYGLYGVNVSSNSSNYVFTNATGYYVFYNTNETRNLTFSRSEYNSTTVEVDSTANKTINVQLVPLEVTQSALFSVALGRYFPFLFSLAYVSWSTNAALSPLFSSYQIIYADNAAMNNPSYLNVSSSGTQSVVLSGIFPGKTYYVTINMYLDNGQIITGNTITISYSNLIDLGMNVVILAGIGIYAYVAIGFVIRRRRRKKSN